MFSNSVVNEMIPNFNEPMGKLQVTIIEFINPKNCENNMLPDFPKCRIVVDKPRVVSIYSVSAKAKEENKVATHVH